MSEIICDVEEVNNAVEQILTTANQYEELAKTLEDLAKALVKLNGSDELQVDLSLANYARNCKEKCISLTDEIRKIQMSILKYSEGDEYIQSFLDSITEEEWKRIFKEEKPGSKKEFKSNDSSLTISDTYKILGIDNASGMGKFGRTAATFIAGFITGFAEFGETLVDGVILGKGMVSSFFASDKDTADKIMAETRATVEYKWAESQLNKFIETEGFLQSVRSSIKAYKELHPDEYNNTMTLGKGLGYTTATLLTVKYGVGAGAGYLAKTLSLGKTGSTLLTSGLVALDAGVMGFSSGTEDAWNTGAACLLFSEPLLWSCIWCMGSITMG